MIRNADYNLFGCFPPKPQFYMEFRDNHEDDSTGVKSLEKVTGQPLDQIEKSWRAWVKTLKYRE